MAGEDELYPYIFIPHIDPLFIEAQADPYNIDKHVRGMIDSPDLASRLDALLWEEVTRYGTPEVGASAYDPARPANYYWSCLILGTLLGRAYALVTPAAIDEGPATMALSKAASCLPHELLLEIHEAYVASLNIRQSLWKVIASIFAKALFSTWPEPGARYTAGVLILTCGKALARTPYLQGRGAQWALFERGFIEPDKIWYWNDVVDALMKTESLPRNNTDSQDLARRSVAASRELNALYANRGEDEEYQRRRERCYFELEHVSQEVLDVFDAAREHSKDATRENDWSSKDVMDRYLGKLDLQSVVTYEQASESGLDDWTLGGLDRLSDYLARET